MSEEPDKGIIGRARRASITLANANPQLGMWQATGTAIGQAPNWTELRDMDTGAGNIAFNTQGHSVRLAAVEEDTGRLALTKTNTIRPFKTRTRTGTSTLTKKTTEQITETTEPTEPQPSEDNAAEKPSKHGHHHHHHHLHLFHKHHDGPKKKAKWGPAIVHGLTAFWKFFITPSGFLITLYGLNIVAWGAMLFFLLLKAAPAMNHPSADDNSSPRKKWLEIDSQILNALFCVTGFGLAPWRFRDLYWFIQGAHMHKPSAMQRLCAQNKSWFRPPTWYQETAEAEKTDEDATKSTTFTGQQAPPTPLWKLGFTIWMMILNTFLQAVLSFFMWHYNRIDRPSWATGTFIGLGCGTGMLAGLMSWWESRKVKKIEGPQVEIVADDTV